jgi:hypothetical protein
VRGGKVKLETVALIGVAAGFECTRSDQRPAITKTANIWGDNNRRGTNSNRIVLFQKS